MDDGTENNPHKYYLNHVGYKALKLDKRKRLVPCII